MTRGFIPPSFFVRSGTSSQGCCLLSSIRSLTTSKVKVKMFSKKYMRTKIMVVALAVGYLFGLGPLAEEVVTVLVSSEALDHIVE